jgi:hypothetical protein
VSPTNTAQRTYFGKLLLIQQTVWAHPTLQNGVVARRVQGNFAGFSRGVSNDIGAEIHSFPVPLFDVEACQTSLNDGIAVARAAVINNADFDDLLDSLSTQKLEDGL